LRTGRLVSPYSGFLASFVSSFALLIDQLIRQIVFKDIGDVLNGFSSNLLCGNNLHVIKPAIRVVATFTGFFSQPPDFCRTRIVGG